MMARGPKQYGKYKDLIQNLLSSWLSPQPQADEAYERMLALEQTREKILQQLPNPGLSPRQQCALDILRRQEAMDQVYRQRCRALEQAGLSFPQRDLLRQELDGGYHQARRCLMTAWPQLESHEYEALPLLLMRLSVAHEIDRRLEALKIDLNFK